jgi:signal transduction histidine kinase
MFDSPITEVDPSPTSTSVLWMKMEAITGLRALRRFGKARTGLFTLGLSTLLIAGDFLTDVRLTFMLLFLVPVALAAWWRGRGLGLCIALLCASGALGVEIVEHMERGRPLHAQHILWNHGGSLAVFVIVIVLVERLRAGAHAEAMARRLAVEQLRQMERLGVVGKLAAGLAHELGTPLNVILGHAELLKSARVTSVMIETSSNTILAQTEKMTAIIRGLLDFSRRSGAERSDVDLDKLAKGASAVLRPLARTKGVAIDVASDSLEPAFVQGNQTELEQVLVNLMMNGIQAMPKGGTLHVRVNAHAHEGGGNALSSEPSVACVEVEDEGVGITPGNLPKIFDPFFTTKDVGEGTGLGLSVSYGIVSDHGGRIQVSSSVGLGTRFSVFLPRVHHEAVDSITPGNGREPTSRGQFAT